MKSFRREKDGSVSAVLEPEEVELLVQLATESAALADAARAGADPRRRSGAHPAASRRVPRRPRGVRRVPAVHHRRAGRSARR